MRRGVLLAVLLTAATVAPAWAAPIVRVKADVRYQGPRVAKSFLGFSQEYNIVQSEVGYEATGVNPVTVGFFRALAAYGGGPPVLRIGGGTQDSTWWNPGGVRPRPSSILYDLQPEQFRALSRFLDQTGGKALVGLNLGANDPQVASDVVNGIRREMRPAQVLGYEVGNEPAFYPERPNGRGPDGTSVFTRPKTYSNAEYMNELRSYVTALRGIDPRLSLAAMPFSLETLPDMLRRHGGYLDTLALHHYPLVPCTERGARARPGPLVILQEDIASSVYRSLRPFARAARRIGMIPRVTEINSAACGGAPGLSDRFAAALWSIDAMFGLAAAGIEGAYFHNSSPLYRAFLSRPTPDGWAGSAQPLFYGMLLFAEATPHGARLLPTTYYPAATIGTAARANMKAWGTVDRHDGVVRVVVMNKGSLRRSVPVEVEIPFAAGDGRVKRLTAPAIDATDGVRWGGQAFPPVTTDGRLQGQERTSRVRRRRGSRYRFTLDSFSAALLTVPVTRTRRSRLVLP